ncbi:MAG: hypothetical protein ACR2GY_13290 [Phycisphaerales bacterium]
MIFELLTVASLLSAPPQITEAAITEAGELLTLVINQERMTAAMWAFVDSAPLKSKGGHFYDRTGPCIWGIVNSEFYYAGMRRPMNGWQWGSATRRFPIDDSLRFSRSAQRGPLDRDAQQRIFEWSANSHRQLQPVEDMIDTYGRANILDWEIYIDCIFLEGDDLSVFAVNDGSLYHWTHNRPEDDAWIEKARVETTLEGPFRVMRAADHLYLIDNDNGDVYSVPEDRHRRIGRIEGWKSLLEDDVLFVVEDHARQKIGVYKVSIEGVPVPLLFQGDADALPDFHVDVPTKELVGQLQQMAEIVLDSR